MTKKLVFLTILIFCLFVSIYCGGDDGSGPSNGPILSNIEFIDTVHYADSQFVSVDVSDPDGFDDIDSVWANYWVPGNSESRRVVGLNWGGLNFFARFKPGGGFLLADYHMRIEAVDLHGNYADTISINFSVIDTSTPPEPVLSDVQLEFFHFYQDSQIVSVFVSEPDGSDDIDSVWGRYYFEGDSLNAAHILFNDDGMSGDSLFGDDRYTAMFLPDSGAFILGNYIVEIQAADSTGNLSLLFDTLFVAADSAGLTWPVLLNLDLEIIHNYTDSQKVSVFVDDPQGYGNIDSVRGEYYYDDVFPVINDLLFYDDGTHGDAFSGDGYFTITFMADSGLFDIGLHYLSIAANDIDGHQSVQLDTTFTTVGNPTLSNIVAPDSLQRGSPDTSYIFIDAFDPDGLADIDSVYFLVTKPDGTSNGIHQYMRDDGIAGDSTASDGTYTLGILAPTMANDPGEYIFRFYSFDLDGNNSNVPEKIITAY